MIVLENLENTFGHLPTSLSMQTVWDNDINDNNDQNWEAEVMILWLCSVMCSWASQFNCKLLFSHFENEDSQACREYLSSFYKNS